MSEKQITWGKGVAMISEWIDTSESYVECSPETVLWRRCTKVASESGEVIDALAGMVGENPRKGVTNGEEELIGELLDTAVAALGAVEHLTGNVGASEALLAAKIEKVLARVGLGERVGERESAAQ